MVSVQFCEHFRGSLICYRWAKNFKLLPNISSHSGFEKLVSSTLQLFSCAYYHRNIKTQGVTTAEIYFLKLSGFY